MLCSLLRFVPITKSLPQTRVELINMPVMADDIHQLLLGVAGYTMLCTEWVLLHASSRFTLCSKIGAVGL